MVGMLAAGRDGDPTACPQAEPPRRFRQSQHQTQQLDEAPRRRGSSVEQQEVLALLCHLHRLEMAMAEMCSCGLLKGGLWHPPAPAVAQRFDEHRALCARIIQQQQQLMAGASLPP